jgi:hypothetical protein
VTVGGASNGSHTSSPQPREAAEREECDDAIAATTVAARSRGQNQLHTRDIRSRGRTELYKGSITEDHGTSGGRQREWRPGGGTGSPLSDFTRSVNQSRPPKPPSASWEPGKASVPTIGAPPIEYEATDDGGFVSSVAPPTAREHDSLYTPEPRPICGLQ